MEGVIDECGRTGEGWMVWTSSGGLCEVDVGWNYVSGLGVDVAAAVEWALRLDVDDESSQKQL
jgi:hypothetical protein